jgi:enolase
VGAYEAHELRDEDARQYGGNGVLKAVHNVENIIGPELVKQRFNTRDLREIDKFMVHRDGSHDKKNLGANAILGVSMACARAGAAEMVCCSFNIARKDGLSI